MAKIKFNNTEYEINDASLAPATADLQSHLSTVLNGSGATIEFGGVSYDIDSAKLSAVTNDFVAHLGTIAGNGPKVIIGGVEYSVDSTKISSAISGLQTAFGNLENSTPSAPTYNGYIPKGEYRSICDGEYNVPRDELPNLYIPLNFKYAGVNYFYIGVEIWEDAPDVWAVDLYASIDGAVGETICLGDTILIGSDVPVTEEQFNAFMYYFEFVGATEPDTPSIPSYNGVIPLGEYVFHPNPDGANLYIADGYDENDEYWAYPDWFTTTDADGEFRTCLGVGCSSDSEEAECYYNPNFMDFLISNGTTITVIAEIEVTKEQFNAFMQYFTPVESN